MNLRLRAYELVFATLVGVTSIMAAIPSQAATEEQSDLVEDYRPSADRPVEMHIPIDLYSPYSLRRRDNGFLFGFNYEIIRPTQYNSFVDLTSYGDMFGTSQIPVYELEIGYKRNFSLGGIALNLGYGSGHVSSDGSGTSRALTISKPYLSLTYIADMIFAEPYVAPYVSAGVTQFMLDENVAGVDSKHTNSYSLIYAVGLLIQLDFLDPTSTKENLMNIGLENTYLDLFASMYDASTSDNDPEMQSGLNVGVGLRFEF